MCCSLYNDMPEQAAGSLFFSAVGNLLACWLGQLLGHFFILFALACFSVIRLRRNMPANMPILLLVPIDQAVPDSVKLSVTLNSC
jgi:hypothetical protein